MYVNMLHIYMYTIRIMATRITIFFSFAKDEFHLLFHLFNTCLLSVSYVSEIPLDANIRVVNKIEKVSSQGFYILG